MRTGIDSRHFQEWEWQRERRNRQGLAEPASQAVSLPEAEGRLQQGQQTSFGVVNPADATTFDGSRPVFKGEINER
jgi:hypothetical protein